MPNSHTPLHERFAIDRDVLHEGVPPWLLQDVEAILKRLLEHFPMLEGSIERTFQLDLSGVGMPRKASILHLARNDGEFMLDCVHLALGKLKPLPAPTDNDDLRPIVIVLDHILDEGNSVWRARWSDNKAGLERRVDPAVHERAETEMAQPTPAAQCLREAWDATYGRDGHPDRAMDRAVRALEAALCPLVIPDDPGPTLGKAVARLRNAPRKFELPLAEPKGADPDGGAVAALGATVDAVWRTHQRHVDADGNVAGNTPAEAEAAVHVAMTVVHMAREGLLDVAGT